MKNKILPIVAFVALSALILTYFIPHRVYADDSLHDGSGIFFIGDSTTNSFKHYGVISEERVWTGVGNTLSMWDISRKRISLSASALEKYKSLDGYGNFSEKIRKDGDKYSMKIVDAVSLVRPKNLVITLGINGCACMSEESFLREYSLIIEAVMASSDTTKIFLNSIFPVAQRSSAVKNSDIERANAIIRSLAMKYRLNYIDSFSYLRAFTDKNGDMDRKILDSEDGIHYSARGCKLICDFIEEEVCKANG